MKTITRRQLIDMYFDFFRSKGHTVIPSASIIPENDREALDDYNIALLYEEDNDQTLWYNKLLSLYAKKTKCRTEISEFEHKNYLRR